MVVMKRKIFIGAGLLIVLVLFSGWYYVFQYSATHHRSVDDETAINVSAVQLVKEYQANEHAANAKYLNKAVEIKGVIAKKDKDQAGNVTLTLKSGDPFAGVFCTLKNKQFDGRDSVVSVKGICTGFLSDVVLNGAIVLKGDK